MKLIDAKQASEMLAIRLPRLYELARRKAIPFVRLGEKQLRFDPDLLAAWVRKGAIEIKSHEVVEDRNEH